MPYYILSCIHVCILYIHIYYICYSIYIKVYIICIMLCMCTYREKLRERWGEGERERERQRDTLFFLMWNVLSNWFPYNTQCSSQQMPPSVYSQLCPLFWKHFSYIIKDSNILIISFEFYILIQALVTHWNVWSFYKNKNIWLIKSPISSSFVLLRKSLGKAIFPEHKGKLHKERLFAPQPQLFFFFPLPEMKTQDDINHQDKSPILRVDKKQKNRCSWDIYIIFKSYTSPDACLQPFCYVRGKKWTINTGLLLCYRYVYLQSVFFYSWLQSSRPDHCLPQSS